MSIISASSFYIFSPLIVETEVEEENRKWKIYDEIIYFLKSIKVFVHTAEGNKIHHVVVAIHLNPSQVMFWRLWEWILLLIILQ